MMRLNREVILDGPGAWFLSGLCVSTNLMTCGIGNVLEKTKNLLEAPHTTYIPHLPLLIPSSVSEWILCVNVKSKTLLSVPHSGLSKSFSELKPEQSYQRPLTMWT